MVDAVAALLKAEAAGLKREFGQTGALLRRLALKFALLVTFGVLAGATLTATIILGLSIFMHPALATLILTVVMTILAGLAFREFRRSAKDFELPTETVRRRLNNHLEWWRDEASAVAHPERSPRVTHLRKEPDPDVERRPEEGEEPASLTQAAEDKLDTLLEPEAPPAKRTEDELVKEE